MRAALGLLIVGLLISAANGSLLVRQTETVTLANAIPITLAASPGISTVLGADATNAVVNSLSLILSTTTNTLQVQANASQSWSVRLHVVSGSGLTGSDAIVLGISNGTAATVPLTDSTLYPQTTGYLTLPAASSAINVTARSNTPIIGDCGGLLGSCTFQVQLRFTPTSTSGPTPEIIYSVTLNTT